MPLLIKSPHSNNNSLLMKNNSFQFVDFCKSNHGWSGKFGCCHDEVEVLVPFRAKCVSNMQTQPPYTIIVSISNTHNKLDLVTLMLYCSSSMRSVGNPILARD